jgi:hypothetical protein
MHTVRITVKKKKVDRLAIVALLQSITLTLAVSKQIIGVNVTRNGRTIEVSKLTWKN